MHHTDNACYESFGKATKVSRARRDGTYLVRLHPMIHIRMHLQSLHPSDKAVSTQKLFAPTAGKAIALQILANGLLKAHQTPVPALLVLVTGEAVFENEKGLVVTLYPGDFVEIEAQVTHWVKGVLDSQLLLLQ